MIYSSFKLLAIGAAFWVLLSLYERASVYPLDASRISPSSLGLTSIREVEFAANGQALVLWVAAPEHGKPVILYFQGNAGNLANRAERFARIADQGYGLVAMAYRGSGGSTGRASERAIAADASLLYEQIGVILPGTPPERVILYGESLGSGIVARLASEQAKTPPTALILEAPYTSIRDVAHHHMPWTRALSWTMTNRWETLKHMENVTAPLMILHGDQDAVIPIEQGREVFDQAPGQDKVLLEVAGAGHDDLWRAPVLPRLWAFIDSRVHPVD